MAFAPSASWNSRSITHLANYLSPSLPMNSSEESILNRCSESVSPHTNRNVPTSACKTGIALKSSDEDRRGTLLPCQTYSIHGRSYKTSGRPCGPTNHRVGIECVGRTGRGFSLDQARGPRQQTGHARGRTYPAIMSQFGYTGGVRTSALEASSLFVLYTPERQVDAWLSHAPFLRHFMLKKFLRVASHDKQTAVWQSLGKCDGAIFSLEPEQASRAQTDGGDYRPHLWFSVRMEPNAVVSIPIQIAEHSVVAQLRQTRVGISRHGCGLFDADS